MAAQKKKKSQQSVQQSVLWHQDDLRAVREQYEAYPYPPRNPEAERHGLTVTAADDLSSVRHYCFGGRIDYSGKRFLVAGGGTGDSTVFLAEQLRHVDAELTYLDMSVASLEVARARCRVRGLEERVQWVQDSLLNLPQRFPEEHFHYINCSGVLHHLAEPEAGLAALRRVLHPEGALALMVYGQYGRMAVYLLQDLLRQLSGPDVPLAEQVARARAVIRDLPPYHWFKTEIKKWDDDLREDGGLVDLLLHTQDRAYTVAQLDAFLASAGLARTAFASLPTFYDPLNYLTDPAIRKEVADRPLAEREALGELMAGRINKHECYVVAEKRAGEAVASCEDPEMIPFFNPVFTTNGPETARDLGQGLLNAHTAEVTLRLRGNAHPVTLPREEAYGICLTLMDGTRTLSELAEETARQLGQDVTKVRDHITALCRELIRCRWVMLRHRHTASLGSYYSKD